MRTTKIITLTLIAAISMLAVSCKKEEQATPQSEEKESPVKAITMNTNSSAWKLDGDSYKAKLMVPDIDQNVLLLGSVTVFIGDGTGYSWTGMPSFAGDYEFKYKAYLSYVEVEALALGNDGNPDNPGSQQFKVVVFKGDSKKYLSRTDIVNDNEMESTSNVLD